MAAEFAPAPLRVDTTRLSSGDRQALVRLIEAGRVVDDIFLDQLWSGNRALEKRLAADRSPLGQARTGTFQLYKGPWSDLDNHRAFLPGVPERRPPGANFYPEDMTRQEFEDWASDVAKGFFTVIRRQPASRALEVVPYSRAYRSYLERAAKLLREAAALTDNSSLKRFLETRATAFLDDDYYASDVAWMDLDAPLDITIGPYETYNDEFFGYKAGFEAYINLRDEKETARLDISPTICRMSRTTCRWRRSTGIRSWARWLPIRVVNEIFSAGDGAHGVRTAAYNLPNDERVVREKGSKRVMLKNIQEAKFRATLRPIAGRVLRKSAQHDLSFDSFFTHIVAHEMSHGIGPHQIRVSGPRNHRPPGVEGTLQCHRRGQGGCHRTLHAAIFL